MSVYWESRAPTFKEIKNLDIPHLVITSDEPWNPQTVNMRPYKQRGVEDTYHPEAQFEIRHVNRLGAKARLIETRAHIENGERTFVQRVINAVRVKKDMQHDDSTVETLAKKLGIGLEMTKQTMEMTTQ